MALRWIWPNLQHYLADADIRAKDADYRKVQNEEMDKLIQLLADGAGEPQIRAVTFLTPTDG